MAVEDDFFFWGFRPIFQGFRLLVSGRGTSQGETPPGQSEKECFGFFRIQIIPYNLEFCYLLDVDGNSDPKNHSPLNGEVLKQCAFHPRVYTQSVKKSPKKTQRQTKIFHSRLLPTTSTVPLPPNKKSVVACWAFLSHRTHISSPSRSLKQRVISS